MHDYIKERTLKIGRYIVETRNTVRTIAKKFGVSKSTVHKDLTERLPEINPELASQVKEILEYHKSIRHIRGGEATKIKYKGRSEKNNRDRTPRRKTGREGSAAEKRGISCGTANIQFDVSISPATPAWCVRNRAATG